MLTFSCPNCAQPLFFDNWQCVRCSRQVGFEPKSGRMLTLTETPSGPPETNSDGFKVCNNRTEQACNWVIPADDPLEHCISCRLTTQRPDASDAGPYAAWKEAEAAKRRMLRALLGWNIPVRPKAQTPSGLEFQFLGGTPEASVVTGHADGVITLNLSEADSVYRENMREKLGEAYRTVLGHLRHEVGHYYWSRLAATAPDWLEQCRSVFGDERADYAASIERHYSQGPSQNWQDSFVSAYATMHPWEDWAETWAHYMHMRSCLETASSYEVRLTAPSPVGAVSRIELLPSLENSDFDALFGSWYGLTFLMNELGRSMGGGDIYPFIVSTTVRAKLEFVHNSVAQLTSTQDL